MHGGVRWGWSAQLPQPCCDFWFITGIPDLNPIPVLLLGWLEIVVRIVGDRPGDGGG